MWQRYNFIIITLLLSIFTAIYPMSFGKKNMPCYTYTGHDESQMRQAGLYLSHKKVITALKKFDIDLVKLWEAIDFDKNDLCNNNAVMCFDELAKNIFTLFTSTIIDNKNNNAAFLKELDLNQLDTLYPLKITCINKITCDNGMDCSDKYHCVSIGHIQVSDEILESIGLVIAYHFTLESLQRRVLAGDETYRSIPLLVISIVKENTTMNPLTKCKITSTIANTESIIIDQELFNEVAETSYDLWLPVKLCLAYLICSAPCLKIFNDIKANNLITTKAISSSVAPWHSKNSNTTQTSPATHDVSFTIGNNKFECSVYKDFTVTCCSSQDHTTACRSFNIVDNIDPLHNCCIADSQGEVSCSLAACANTHASRPVCGYNSKLYQNNISFSEKHYALMSEYRKMLEHHQDTVKNIPLYEFPLLLKHIRAIENHLGISEKYRITSISIHDIPYDIGMWVTEHDNNLRITRAVGEEFPDIISFDVVVGHELSHKYQLQKGATAETSRPCGPAAEIDADILGSLANINVNPNAAQDLAISFFNIKKASHYYYDKMRNNDVTRNKDEVHDRNALCRTLLPLITRATIKTIPNLIKQEAGHVVHPADLVRTSMLLKLNTMIKALLYYFENNKDNCKQLINKSKHINATCSHH